MSAHVATRYGCLIALIGTFSVSYSQAAEPTQRQRLQSVTLVEEALQHESLGLNAQRDALLREAEQLAAKQPAVHWALGRVEYRQRWVDATAVPELLEKQAGFQQYRELRGNYADTPEGQFKLAEWCDKHDLPLQRQAHLERVIELAPNHLPAREALGFVRAGEQWVSREEIEHAGREEQKLAASMKQWAPTITEIRADLLSSVTNRRKAAADRLAKIDDVRAVPAIEAILCREPLEVSQQAVAALAKLSAQEATRALARQAVYSPWQEVREAATTALKDRPWDQFVPLLIGSLYTPIEARTQYFRGPGDRLVQQHVFVREGQTQNQVLTASTAFKREALPSGDARETTQRAHQAMRLQRLATEQQLFLQNLNTEELNRRIIAVLSGSTREEHGDRVHDWWKWWNEYNEVFIASEKQLVSTAVQREVSIMDRPVLPPPPAPNSNNNAPANEPATGAGGQTGRPTVEVTEGVSSSNIGATPRTRTATVNNQPLTTRQRSLVNIGFGLMAVDCLAAGTPVWTNVGQTSIEQIRVGDLVLSQNIETGELAYKPVLRTTVRPAGQLVKIAVGYDMHLQTSGGHPFWVSGTGWVKARELKSGMLLHTPTGTQAISSIEQGTVAKTYNLVVADFHTYFAGDDRLLSHDNTVRRATDVVVPGLAVTRDKR